MCIEVSALLASSILLLMPYLFWGIIIYGAYKAILLFAEEYKVKRDALEEPHRQLLEEKFTYYRQLNQADRKTFEKRVKTFLREKEFIARGGLNITEEMKLLVAACAIQLTFGLPPVYLVHFKKILLYPEEYYSTLNQTYHVGGSQRRWNHCVVLETFH
jgi:Mlc titration factor MtfA (ptsG expression regulator)